MRQAEFIGGALHAKDVETLPFEHHAPFFAFAGRSNVGKSSLINALTKSRIARISKSPGKTREMNFYNVPALGARGAVVVDLPGYGFAKVSAKLRELWGKEITRWLLNEDRLAGVFVVVDSRHGFLESDLECLAFLNDRKLRFGVIFTKLDKWKSPSAIKKAEKDLLLLAERLGVEQVFFTSAEKNLGLGTVKGALVDWSRV